MAELGTLGNVDSPLTEDHCAALDSALQIAARLRTLIQQCKGCEMDVSRQEEELAAGEKMASLLKKTFFPARV